MELLQPATRFSQSVADRLGDSKFTLLDIGCSGGIDRTWRVFGSRLRAFGFDPNIEDVARLNAKETLPEVSYVAAFVGLPDDDPGMTRLRTRSWVDRSPWSRLSVARTLEIRASDVSAASSETKTRLNVWGEVPLADPAKPIVLPDFLRSRNIDDVDFIKIDVDGPDFLILRSLKAILTNSRVLGVGIEVNYHGSDDPDVHTFHNVDRFMRGAGFELFGLTVRTYSSAALPAPYLYSIPAQTAWGRPLQGDALYLRDTGLDAEKKTGNADLRFDAAKLAKLAALFSLFGLPDMAVETLLRHRGQFAELLDVDREIDVLTAQAASKAGWSPKTYAEHMAAFEADSRCFYPLGRELGEFRNEIETIRRLTDRRIAAPLRMLRDFVLNLIGRD